MAGIQVQIPAVTVLQHEVELERSPDPEAERHADDVLVTKSVQTQNLHRHRPRLCDLKNDQFLYTKNNAKKLTSHRAIVHKLTLTVDLRFDLAIRTDLELNTAPNLG